MAQTLSEIKALLAGRGIHPRHRFGQNFLIDQNKLRQIVDAAAITPGDVVLEVGPGTGTLTEAMLEAGGRVIAVEIDRDLADILRERIGADSDRFVLINEDVLASKRALNPKIADALRSFAPGADIGDPQADVSFSLVANLPYNVASPLLINLAVDYPAMKQAIVMVQREVADRITAGPGGKDFGPMSIVLQALCETQTISTLSPGCFWPRPQVDSAVVKLTRRDQPLTTDAHRLSKFVQMLFQKRRKQVGSILGREHPLPPEIAPTARPEQLSVQQIIGLAEQATG